MKGNLIKIVLIVLVLIGVLYNVCYADVAPLPEDFHFESVNGEWVIRPPTSNPTTNPEPEIEHINFTPIIIAGIAVVIIVVTSLIVLIKKPNGETQKENNKSEE